jgi:asparagine synthase (glutamine-hydrolysing)
MEELEALLADATRIRLRSDVPVGIFLSGGIDSGLTGAFASRAAGRGALRALTVAWDEADLDESALAVQTAGAVGLEASIVRARPADVGLVDRIAWNFDEPFADASALPTYLLCEAAHEQGTVFLGGDGGDEAFGGYGRYVGSLRHCWLSRLPAAARTSLKVVSGLLPELSEAGYRARKASLSDSGFAGVWDGIPEDPALKIALGEDRASWYEQAGAELWRRWAETSGRDLLSRMQALDYSLYLPDDILVKVDRASMAHSIEVRSPFLDYRVVEFASRIPRSELADGREGKKPLRALARKFLPAEVASGKKRGFGVPLEKWFRNPATLNWLRDRLLSNEALRRGLWDRRGVDWLIRHHETGFGRDLSGLLWRLLVLDAWARWYLDSDAFRTGPPT